MRIFSQGSRTNKIGQGGFGLVEAMVAIAIFAIGILGAYKMQLHATQSNALANRVSTATTLAGYAIEEILGKQYDHADLDDNPDNGINGLNAGLPGVAGSPDGAVYVYGDGSIRDVADGNELYSVFYNVVEGDPDDPLKNTVLVDTKLIRVHVIRNGGIGNGHLYTHDYYKALHPES